MEFDSFKVLQKLWNKDKISFFAFCVSMGSLILMALIIFYSAYQSVFSPRQPFDFSITANMIIWMFILAIPLFVGMFIFQYRLSSKTTQIEKEVDNLSKSSAQKGDNKIITEIQRKKHKIFYYLNEESIQQIFSQIRGDISPKSLELQQISKTDVGFNVGFSQLGTQIGSHADSEQGHGKKITFEISPTVVNQFVEVQKALFEENEVTSDLADVEELPTSNLTYEWLESNEELPPKIRPEAFKKISGDFQFFINKNFKDEFEERLSTDIHQLIEDENKEKQIMDFVSHTIQETISFTIYGISKQELIKKTIKKFENCKTFVVLNEDFSVSSVNNKQIVLDFDHKINKYLDPEKFIKIQIICEDRYFSESQKVVIQKTGSKLKCICLAILNRWDSESKTLTLIPIALYK